MKFNVHRPAPSVQSKNPDAEGAVSASAEKEGLSERAAGRKTEAPAKRSSHRLDGRGSLSLPEILTKIASAMPCDPDHSLAVVWEAAQASTMSNRSKIESHRPLFSKILC